MFEKDHVVPNNFWAVAQMEKDNIVPLFVTNGWQTGMVTANKNNH